MARFLDKHERFEEAEIEYRKAVELDPDDLTACYDWRVMLFNQMKYEEAKAKFQELIISVPEDLGTLASYGLVRGLLGDLENETQMYLKAVNLIKDDQKSIYREIVSYEKHLQKLETKLSCCHDNKIKQEHFR